MNNTQKTSGQHTKISVQHTKTSGQHTKTSVQHTKISGKYAKNNRQKFLIPISLQPYVGYR